MMLMMCADCRCKLMKTENFKLKHKYGNQGNFIILKTMEDHISGQKGSINLLNRPLSREK